MSTSLRPATTLLRRQSSPEGAVVPVPPANRVDEVGCHVDRDVSLGRRSRAEHDTDGLEIHILAPVASELADKETQIDPTPAANRRPRPSDHVVSWSLGA